LIQALPTYILFRMETRITGSMAVPPVRKDLSAKLKGLAILLSLLILPVAWRWTSLNQWINCETIMGWQDSVQNSPGAFFAVMGVYLLGSVTLFPVTILNVATVFTFGPILGNTYALTGWLSSAALGYGIGRAIGQDLLRKMAGPRLDRLIRQAGHHGFLTVLTMRVLPVAPFTLVNLFVGASGIRFGDFSLASLLGRIPGMVVLSTVGVQLQNALRTPTAGSFVLLGFTLLLLPLMTAWLVKQFVQGAAERSSSRSGRAGPAS
jgi:uncharacterized membrane protein YdjX (TVP38/TMEM64 family)